MTLTPEQMRIVEENMGLVGKVIKDKVHGLGQAGTPEYDDLFQTGCIGLCKAAATDKGGCFSTYAYRLIWNEICDELARSTRLVQKEQGSDTIDTVVDAETGGRDELYTSELRHTLRQAKSNAAGVTAKGIACLELTIQGYNSQEIAKLFKAEAATVRMWMTKARRYLQSIPELKEYMYPEAV